MASNSNNTVSFKVFLKSLDGETETRRFVVDRDVATSFAYLQVKLLFFNSLKLTDISIRERVYYAICHCIAILGVTSAMTTLQ